MSYHNSMCLVSVASRRCTRHQLLYVALLAMLLSAQCRQAAAIARSDMLIGYKEESPTDAEVEDCEDRMSEQICQGYKESGMCGTGEVHGLL